MALVAPKEAPKVISLKDIEIKHGTWVQPKTELEELEDLLDDPTSITYDDVIGTIDDEVFDPTPHKVSTKKIKKFNNAASRDKAYTEYSFLIILAKKYPLNKDIQTELNAYSKQFSKRSMG